MLKLFSLKRSAPIYRMSDSEDSWIPLLDPQKITAAVSTAFLLTKTADDVTGSDETGAHRPTSVSNLNIEDMSLRENLEPRMAIAKWTKRCCNTPITSKESYSELFRNDDSDDSMIEFPSPGSRRRSPISSNHKLFRKRFRNSSPFSRAESYGDGCVGAWQVYLENRDLWQKFSEIGTEMVITKNGRRMFPTIQISLSGLDPSRKYSIKLAIPPSDNLRYKFSGDHWVVSGTADKLKEHLSCTYTYPDCPNSGCHLMKKPLSFKFIKLTNTKGDLPMDKTSDRVSDNHVHI